ncbi:MAG: universal stress protein [Deinococcales bacterium]|nr:universal stress protein [Deinococcales bacterium]
MFEILFPLTGSFTDASALPHALEMARVTGARVHLVRVLESRRASDRPIDPVDWHIKKLEAEGALAEAAARFAEAGVPVEEVLLEGNPTEHLLHYAHRTGAELIVLAGGTGRGTIGALGGELLWRSYLTTLLVRPVPLEPVADEPETRAASTRATFERGRGLDTRPVDQGAFSASTLSAALSRVTVSRWLPGRGGGRAAAALVPAGAPAPGTEATLAPGAEATPAGAAAGAPGDAHAGAPAGAPPLGSAAPTSVVGAPWPRPTPGDAPRAAADVPGAGDAPEEPPAEAARAPRARQGVRYARIVTALDGSMRAECVLPWVRRLAQQHDAEVILAHVVVEPELPRLTPPSEEDVALARRLMERNRVAAAAYLDDARKRLGIEASTRLVEGAKVSVALHDLVDREAVDLMVLSAHGHGGEPRWPFGDVATSFIGYGRTPLLLVQDMAPGGFPADGGADRWGG